MSGQWRGAVGEEGLSVLVFTWNMGNAQPDEGELAQWLPDGAADPAACDIIAVGTQESSFKMKKHASKPASESLATTTGSVDPYTSSRDVPEGGVDATVETTAVHLGETAVDNEAKQQLRAARKCSSHWDQMMGRRLGQGYYIVRRVTFGEMRLTLYAKRSLRVAITRVRAARSACGFLGRWPNKGGLVVKLEVQRVSIAFVSCHLAAHDQFLERRNQNCQEILQETRRSIGCSRLNATCQFDHCFWFGDLNYRVNLKQYGGLERGAAEVAHHEAVVLLAEQRRWDQLLAADQLNACKAEVPDCDITEPREP